MDSFCKDTIMKGLDEWSKSIPQELLKSSRFIKDMADIRLKDEGAKAKIIYKYSKSATISLPAKYIRSTGKENIELIIVERDSAKGTAELNRDPKTLDIPNV